MVALISIWSSGGYVFIPFSGFRMDWIQFAYDVVIGVLSGIVIEIFVSRAGIKHSFETEIQDLSRYLDALKQLVDLYPMLECGVEIAQLIALSPRHESFRYLADIRGLPRRLATLEDEIRQSVVACDLNDAQCKTFASRLIKIRNEFVRLELSGPFLLRYRIKRLFQWARRRFDDIRPW